jgi:hypothetical protein
MLVLSYLEATVYKPYIKSRHEYYAGFFIFSVVLYKATKAQLLCQTHWTIERFVGVVFGGLLL